MIEIKVYNDIAKEDVLDRLFLCDMGMSDALPFSADTIHEIFESNPTETDFKFNINCDGGSVSEGLRIYDVLRNSGKNLYTNIENSCHSIAILLLLAAPAQNRTANPNSRSLIHHVYGYGIDINATQAQDMADTLRQEESAILAIYQDRTGTDLATLTGLMDAEKELTAQQMKNYGFISKINTYNTNKKKTQMATIQKKEKPDLLNKATQFLQTVKNLLDGTEPTNYDFTDADGNVVFSTTKSDDTLEVGDAVTLADGSDSGTFTLDDGREVTITGGVVESVNAKPAKTNEELQTENATLAEKNSALEAEKVELTNKVTALTNKLTEASTLITNLKDKVGSTFNVAPRATVVGKQPQKKTFEELKNEAIEKRKKYRGNA